MIEKDQEEEKSCITCPFLKQMDGSLVSYLTILLNKKERIEFAPKGVHFRAAIYGGCIQVKEAASNLNPLLNSVMELQAKVINLVKNWIHNCSQMHLSLIVMVVNIVFIVVLIIVDWKKLSII